MIHRLSGFALRAALALALILLPCVYAAAQQGQSAQPEQTLASISYHLSMPRPASHLFEVSMNVEAARETPLDALDFQMPKWSPGRYAVFDFAKNVQEVEAAGSTCLPNAPCAHSLMIPLEVTRVDDQTWRVEMRPDYAGGKIVYDPAQPLPRIYSVTVKYKVFGDDLSGTFSQLDTRHANYNGGNIFMYIVGHKPDPVMLTIDPPAGWRIVNGRTERVDQRDWKFPNYDIMIDTPTEIAPDWTRDDFKVDGKTYHVVVHSFGNEGGKRPLLVKGIERIVRAETQMWGAPEFDEYTFLLHFAADDHSGDGMEHLTSTQIIEPGALGEPGMLEDTLEVVAHEFFHVWNVKRLRPLGLGPWDFTRPANTRGLWIAEGFTNYYGHLMLRRADVWTDAQFLKTLGEYITGIENAQGSRLMSAEASSLSAPFIDDAPHAQKNNLGNTSISYYNKGETLAIVLDLMIRGKTEGRASLDEVMRRAYEEFYLKSPNDTYYLRGRSYTDEDFMRVATEVSGQDLKDFFTRHVRGVEPPPYDEAFAQVGLRLVRTVSRQPYNAGLSFDYEEPLQAKIKNVRNGSVAENAGLKQGDIILSVGGTRVTSDISSLLAALSRYKEGSRVPIALRRDRRTINTTLTLGPPERYDYRIEEKPDATPQMRALRAAWMKG